MAQNVPAMYEAHFGIPMTGAVLNTLNIRLNAEAIAFQLTHGEAKVLITDREFSQVVKPALSMMERRILVIDINDPLHHGGTLLGEMFASQRGLGYMLMNAIGLHNVDIIMSVTFMITVFAATVSGILLAIDRRLHHRG